MFSQEIQNDLIHSLVAEIVSHIARACQGRYFSILCDEVTDRSNDELLGLFVRYILDSGVVNEDVLALVWLMKLYWLWCG